MPDVQSIVLNDETVVNSYGFRVKNAGINLARFKENPVMLAQHYNSVWTVIGRWDNIRLEGTQLLADPVFDDADPDSAIIAGKVKRGFLKGSSIGFIPDEQDSDYNFKKADDGIPELLTCELLEASIVAIPANRAAVVKMYAADGVTMLSADLIKLSLSTITPENFINPDMSKITLKVKTLAALGLENADNLDAVSEKIDAIVALSAEKDKNLTTANEKITALEAKLKEFEGSKAVELVDGAINAKKLGADQRDSFLKLASTDFEAAKTLIEGMSPRKELGATITNSGAASGTLSVKTEEDFMKLSLEDQLSWKADNPEEYKKLFNA